MTYARTSRFRPTNLTLDEASYRLRVANDRVAAARAAHCPKGEIALLTLLRDGWQEHVTRLTDNNRTERLRAR